MNWVIIIMLLVTLATGCTSRSRARGEARNAYQSGQRAALERQLAQQRATVSITVNGPVQYPSVPWVAGITLAQALATANYIGQNEPSQITLTRQGEDATIDPKDLDGATRVILEPGDVITLR